MSAPNPAPLPAIEAARRCAERGELAQAVAGLEHALSATSAHDERIGLVQLLAELARRAAGEDDLAVAQAALETATHHADWADLWCQLGGVLVARGRRREARAALDRALALNPRYRGAVVERALLDASEGRIAEAMHTLRVLAAEGAVAEPGALARGLDRLGEAAFEEAAPLLRRALASGDPWLEEQLRRYQELLDRGDGGAAVAALRAAAEERPGYPDLQLLLGAHERQGGALDDALESLVHALELHPGFHAARVELARALETLGDTGEALRQLELVLAAEPAHAEAAALHARWLARRRAVRPADAPAQRA